MAIQRKTIISSMLWNIMERFSTQIVSFVISIILARILAPEEYGIIALIIIFVSLGSVIIDGGLNTALIQKKDSDQLDFSTIFWFCLLVATILYTVLFFGAPLIASFYDKDILTPVLRVLSLVLFANSINSIQRAYVSRHMLFKKLFWINAVAVLISGTIGITMANKGYGVWALVGQSLSNPIVCCVLMWFTIKWRPTLQFSKERFRGLFDYGWKIFLTNFIVSIYENIRSLIIGKVYQPSALAFFERGKSLPHLLMSNITASINTVLLPAFSDEQDDRERVKKMMRRSVQMSYFFIFPILIGFIFSAKNIVLLLLTEKWLPAVPFVQIFCIAFILMPIQNVNMTAIKSLGYSNITLKLEVYKKILEAIILIVSFLINVYAVAWGIVLYNLICIFINLHPSKQLVDYGWNEQVKDILPTFIASILMGGAVWGLNFLSVPPYIILSLQVIVAMIVYGGICFIIKEESLLYIRELVMKRRSGEKIV